MKRSRIILSHGSASFPPRLSRLISPSIDLLRGPALSPLELAQPSGDTGAHLGLITAGSVEGGPKEDPLKGTAAVTMAVPLLGLKRGSYTLQVHSRDNVADTNLFGRLPSSSISCLRQFLKMKPQKKSLCLRGSVAQIVWSPP